MPHPIHGRTLLAGGVRLFHGFNKKRRTLPREHPALAFPPLFVEHDFDAANDRFKRRIIGGGDVNGEPAIRR